MLFATYSFVCHNVDRFAEKNHLQVDSLQAVWMMAVLLIEMQHEKMSLISCVSPDEFLSLFYPDWLTCLFTLDTKFKKCNSDLTQILIE